jgi:Rrf2 family transcriptional regulator, cysteine metabolism repressor
MKFSTKAEYGLRAIIHVAKSTEPVSLASIAKKEKLSLPYLERIFSVLKKNNIVKSYKGVNGGYVLVDSVEEVTVGSIITVLEDGLYKFECKSCSVANCHLHSVWAKLHKQIGKTLNSITLKSLIK